MLVGEPAFPCHYTDEAEIQEENIINGVYKIPEERLSPAAIDLLKNLIKVDYKKRLPIAMIKKHKFFEEIDWEKCDKGEQLMPEA